MENIVLTHDAPAGFADFLRGQEKSRATIDKYLRGAGKLIAFLNGAPLSREAILAFKTYISARHTAAGINGTLAAVNCFTAYLGRPEFKVRLLKIQSRMFTEAERELSQQELLCLAETARKRGKTRIYHVLQTLAATGIRVGELPYITIEALRAGRAEINLKGKVRVVLLPTALCKRLEDYARAWRISSGPVFVTRSGKPLDRSNIWKALKRLSEYAHVPGAKVYPHNLRHLFARSYYEKRPDLVELAGILGHSNINTTRIYTATLGSECRMRLDAMQLIP